MHISSLMWLLFFILTIGVGWAIYWLLMRPVLMDDIEGECYALRSRVEWAIIEGDDSAHSRAAQLVSQSVARPDLARHYSFSCIVYHLARNTAQLRAKAAQERELFRDAPAWIRESHAESVSLTTQAALANSPIWWGPIAVLMFFSYFSSKASAWWSDLQISAYLLPPEELQKCR